MIHIVQFRLVVHLCSLSLLFIFHLLLYFIYLFFFFVFNTYIENSEHVPYSYLKRDYVAIIYIHISLTSRFGVVLALSHSICFYFLIFYLSEFHQQIQSKFEYKLLWDDFYFRIYNLSNFPNNYYLVKIYFGVLDSHKIVAVYV